MEHQYWAYENWKNGPHRIRIHSEECIHVPAGFTQGPVQLGTGRCWHGPFLTLEEADDFARPKSPRTSFCNQCLRYELKEKGWPQK